MEIAQAVGFLALFFNLIAFQYNSRVRITWIRTIGNVLFAIHYYLLGALTGMAMNAINLPRNIIFLQNEKYAWARSYLWPVGFSMLYILASIYTWVGVISIFPAIGNIFGIASVWLPNPRHIRIAAICGGLAWVAYNIAVISYPGLISGIISMASITIGIYRFDREYYHHKFVV